jgi:hypothetical protein
MQSASLEGIEVRRVSTSADLLHPGEYVYIAKRQPKITIEREPLAPPTGFIKLLWWNWFGKKYEIKQIVELMWPESDTIIFNCPECNGPCATTSYHKITSIEPLTLEAPITCPYCKTNSFRIAEGKLTLING